jgi:Flp pilus assembly protein TadD
MESPMRRFSSLIFVFFLSTLAFAQKPGDPGLPTPPAPDYSKEGYVIEQFHTTYRFENDGTGRRELYVKVKVQSEAGVRDFGQLVFGYNSVNERVEIPFVRVLKADGTTVTAPPDAVQDLSPPITKEAPVYTDYRQKHVTVPGLRPGETLEYDMVAVMHTPLAPNQFWMEHDFTKAGIILDEQLEVNVPADRKVTLKNKPEYAPKITEENGRRIYRWTSSNLTTDEDDDSKKDKDDKKKKKKKSDDTPAVQMTTFSSWEEIGRWYAGLEKDRREPNDEIRAKAAALTAGKTTDLDKVEALYDYVARNFRYVSLSFGTGRYQPHAASEVLHNQYGDCKDKHTLLASLLDAEGMHASSVLINSSRKLDPDVPSPSQFDHVITLLPLGKEEVWMDTTTEVAPFRLLAYTLRKKQALVVPESGTPHLEETPADPPMPDTETQEVVGKVNDAGKLEAKVQLGGTGDTDLGMRTVFRRVPNAQWKRVAEMFSAAGGISGDVDDLDAGDPADTHKPFGLSYKITDSDFLDWTKKKLDVSLPLSRSDLPDADLDDSPDADPIQLGPPGTHVYKIRLELPAKYTMRIPVSFTVKRDYGEYQATYHQDGQVFTAERTLVMRVRELPQDRGRDYLAFRNAVASDIGQQLSLESTVAGNDIPADLKPDDLNSSGYQAIINGNYTLAVDLLLRCTTADPKNKYAWNNLGLAYSNLGKNDDAISAFKKQVELNPYDEYAYTNMGFAYQQQHKYEEAAAAYQKELEINPLDKRAHVSLGVLYVEWKKYSDAVPELEKAVSLTPDNAELHIQLGTAYLNLGQADKAQSSFEKAIQISATPLVWNNIAYQLSLKGARLDLAQQYAESAVASTAAASRNLTLEQPTMRDVVVTNSLSAYWDTLGWVLFGRGDTDKAQKYVEASWMLSGHGEVGEHLGEIYEKQKKKERAIRTYALSVNSSHPSTDSRAKLAALVGDKQVEETLAKNHDMLQDSRTVFLGKVAKVTGTADFLVLLGANGAESVKFISGEPKLKDMSDALRAAKYQVQFPDDTPAKLLRRGTLSCSTNTGNCEFVLLFPDDVHSVE